MPQAAPVDGELDVPRRRLYDLEKKRCVFLKRAEDAEREQNQFRQLADDAEREQRQLAYEQRANPGFQEEYKGILAFRAKQQPSIEPLPISEFVQRRHEKSSPQGDRSTERSADRSKWSAGLRKLIEEQFPEATKEERIRKALETPHVILGEGLPEESIRFYIEELEFEDDF